MSDKTFASYFAETVKAEFAHGHYDPENQLWVSHGKVMADDAATLDWSTVTQTGTHRHPDNDGHPRPDTTEDYSWF